MPPSIFVKSLFRILIWLEPTISIASKKGADLLMTGDVGHHQALEAESLGITLIDAGHFHTEKAAFEIFAERLTGILKAKGWGATVEVDEDERDPLHEG